MDDINFSDLAAKDADFAKILKSNGQLDFSNPEAVLQLTKSLLKQHFNLKIELPADRLCPPVPNRFNYIKWVQELLDTTSFSYIDVYEPNREVIGLDIGTGASCIYPLLGCTSRPNWRFIGTDIDDKSFEYAQRNVNINSLESRIRLLKTTSGDPLVSLDILGIQSIDFTISNPPFYASTTSLLESSILKSLPPSTACTGSPSEMIYPGGEVSFITTLINESLVLTTRVQWYTTMLGKLESLKELLVILKQNSITNYALKELIQGTKTRRWALAWSFHPFHPPPSISRAISPSSSLPKASLPFPSEFSFSISNPPTTSIIQPKSAFMADRGVMNGVKEKIGEILGGVEVRWQWEDVDGESSNFTRSNIGLGFSNGNVWSRASRRKKKGLDTNPQTQPRPPNDEEQDMSFGFKISINPHPEEGKLEVMVRWIKGFDSVVFESFCGMLKRRVEGG